MRTKLRFVYDTTPNQRSEGCFHFKCRVIWHKADGEMCPSIQNQDGFAQTVKGVSLWKVYQLKKKSHLTCCKSNPLSSPVKWVYRAYGTGWLLGILQRQICWRRILCYFLYFLLQIYYSLLLKYFLAENKVWSKPKPQSLYFIFEHIVSRHLKINVKALALS